MKVWDRVLGFRGSGCNIIIIIISTGRENEYIVRLVEMS